MWLQVAVNRCPSVIDAAIAETLRLAQGESIEWVSPLKANNYVEYCDQRFVESLGVDLRHKQLKEFWPSRGPVWDGLALTSNGRCLLVEAKANVPEFNSSPSGASEESLRKIRRALDDTKAFLSVRSKTDWTQCFYQYANRLAHLYFLKEVNEVDAALVFVYFVGDDTVPDRNPVSEAGWEAAIDLATHHLGVRLHSPWMRDNVADVFIDVNDLRPFANS